MKEVRGLACCPNGLFNIQQHAKSLEIQWEYELGSWSGFKMVDHWVMHYIWEFTRLCNYCSMDLGILTSEGCVLFHVTPYFMLLHRALN